MLYNIWNLQIVLYNINYMIKIEGKEKIKKIKNFLTQLKSSQKITPFLNKNNLIEPWGFWDFNFIKGKNKLTLTTIQNIQRRLTNYKYQYLKDLIDELKEVFLQVSEYVFLDDPLQEIIQQYLQQIDNFQENYIKEERGQNQIVKPTKRIKVSKQPKNPVIETSPDHKKSSTFAQKIQMIYYIKAHQDNQPVIQKLGDLYHIGKQVDNDYVIKLDNLSSSSWTELLQKKNN